jgi:hypothetical protein
MAGGTPRRRKGSSPLPGKRAAPATKATEPARLGLTPRRSVAAARTEAAQSMQRFVRQHYWNGMAAGDVVRVAGHTPRGRHWRFRAHVTNTSNGATWVEVALVDGPPPSKRPSVAASNGTSAEASPEISGESVGPVGSARPAGSPRVEKVRSFDPDLITPRWRGRGRVATLLRPGGGASAKPAQDDQAQALSEQTSLF